jgi:2,3-bisphosphoglycerate-independent phosphoglycerate mutase
MPESARPNLLFLFLDGVGIGPADPARNPFLTARLPHLREILGGHLPTLEAPEVTSSRAVAFPIDACLGVDGTPQSGTGQTALLTGENAPRMFGRHFGPWVPTTLRSLVEERSLLKRSVEAGHATAFANAYPKLWPAGHPRMRRRRAPRAENAKADLDAEGGSGRRVAAPPLAARAASLLTRHEEALAAGDAISSEITNEGWRHHLGFTDLPEIGAHQAGKNLARIAAGARLTLFAHYATDTAGHRGGLEGAVGALERVDEFLGGILSDLPSDALLLIASDHGNIEDVSTGHTRNPALGVIVGPDASARRERIDSLVDVAPSLLDWLDSSTDSTASIV